MSAKEISNSDNAAAREVTDKNQSVDAKELSDTELENVSGGINVKGKPTKALVHFDRNG
jgi:bacteriocin-like protein